MEEVLTAVMKALAESPQLALWALAIIYLFKVVVVGSIYGTVRFAIDRVHSMYTTPKHTLTVIDIEAKLRAMTIGDPDGLIAQLERLANRNKVTNTTGSGAGILRRAYIHDSDVRWLRQAIDDRLDKDQKNKESNLSAK